jgi:hypothetical protein
MRFSITPPAWWPLNYWPLGSTSTLPVGDCHCNAVGKQAAMTGKGYQVSITGKGYQATIAGVNG